MLSDDRVFPTAYAQAAIGVNDAQEAIEAFHFCTSACRTAWLAETPTYTDGGYSVGWETLSVDGDCCTQCGRALNPSL